MSEHIFFRRAARCLWRLAVLALVVARPAPAAAETQVHTLFDFTFEDGTTVPDLHVAYDTQGTLSPARDNAILLLHDTFADRHAFDDLIGPGKTFDTSRYFVITADAIGGGESSSPSDGGGQDFPRYTIRDVMAADYAMVSRGLGLTRLHAVVGRAMGSFVALEWGVQHPETASSLVLLGPSPRVDANYRTVVDLMLSAIALDPEWDGGRYAHEPVAGLRHAGMTYYPWAVTAGYLDRLSSGELARESEATARAFAQWDANALVLRFAACRGHDVAAPFDGDIGTALARVTMPVLLLANAGDRLVGIDGARRLRGALPHATYAEIPSDLGFRAMTAPPGTAEAAFIDRAIRSFLAAPASRPRGE